MCQDVPNFIFRDSMIVNVRLARIRILVEAEFHANAASWGVTTSSKRLLARAVKKISRAERFD
jgi:hypothetical protein